MGRSCYRITKGHNVPKTEKKHQSRSRSAVEMEMPLVRFQNLRFLTANSTPPESGANKRLDVREGLAQPPDGRCIDCCSCNSRGFAMQGALLQAANLHWMEVSPSQFYFHRRDSACDKSCEVYPGPAEARIRSRGREKGPKGAIAQHRRNCPLGNSIRAKDVELLRIG